MKKLFAPIVGLFLVACNHTNMVESGMTECQMQKQNLQLKLDSLSLILQNLEDENKTLIHELQWREMEVSYWGQKYDSTLEKLEAIEIKKRK